MTSEELAGFKPNPYGQLEERLVRDGTFVFAGGHCADERQRTLPWQREQGHAYEFDTIAASWIEQGGLDADMCQNQSGREALLGNEADYAFDGGPR